MKSLSAILISLLASSIASATPGAIGSWRLPDVNQNGITLEFVVTVGADSTMNTVTCTGFGQRASVSATSMAIVTDSQVQSLERNTNSTEVNGLRCRASTQVGSFSYVIANDGQTMIMTLANGQTISLARQ